MNVAAEIEMKVYGTAETEAAKCKPITDYIFHLFSTPECQYKRNAWEKGVVELSHFHLHYYKPIPFFIQLTRMKTNQMNCIVTGCNKENQGCENNPSTVIHLGPCPKSGTTCVRK